MLDLVQLESFADRRPTQLSGGQKQRVALARALINQPKVLLLDEPLGALDLKLREEMQTELKSLQQRLGITFVFVTHDQGEALSMANRVAVFNAGRIEQLDTPRALYTRPKTAFVAGFVGSANVVESDLAERLTGRRPGLRDPPRADPDRDERRSARGSRSAQRACSRTSSITAQAAAVTCASDDGAVLAVAQAESGDAAALPAPGTRVRISWPRASAVPLE